MHNELKQKLLNLDFVIDNEYLDKYVELIEANRETKREKFKTQSHHIIPRCYFKLNNLNIDNSKGNLVNLLYKDHVLAHYYICLCCKNNNLKYANISAIFHVLGNVNYKINESYLDEVNFLKSLDKYQELYEYMRRERAKRYMGHKYTHISDKQKLQISVANKCLIYVYNENGVKKIYQHELGEYLSKGWKRGNPPCRHKFNKKVSGAASYKHPMIINNGFICKTIERDTFINYSSEWKKGRIKLNLKDLNEEQLEIIKDKIVKTFGTFIPKEELPVKIRLEKGTEKIRIRSNSLYGYLLCGWDFTKNEKIK